MDIAKKIEQAVKALELDKEFPHTHHYDMCYSYDGHRSDLDCNLPETPHVCGRCHGTGKSGWECGKCRGTGIRGGTEAAQKRLLKYLEQDEPLDRLLSIDYSRSPEAEQMVCQFMYFMAKLRLYARLYR
jgi:hypothetical protein